MVRSATGLYAGRGDAHRALAAMGHGGANPARQSQALFRVGLLCSPELSSPLQPAHAPADPEAESSLMPTRKLIVDGKEIEAEDNITLLQACEQAGAGIP